MVLGEIRAHFSVLARSIISDSIRYTTYAVVRFELVRSSTTRLERHYFEPRRSLSHAGLTKNRSMHAHAKFGQVRVTLFLAVDSLTKEISKKVIWISQRTC